MSRTTTKRKPREWWFSVTVRGSANAIPSLSEKEARRWAFPGETIVHVREVQPRKTKAKR